MHSIGQVLLKAEENVGTVLELQLNTVGLSVGDTGNGRREERISPALKYYTY